MEYKYPQNARVDMGVFLRAWLGKDPTFDGMMKSIETMLNDNQSPDYIGSKVVVTSGEEQRFLRDELSMMAERIDYAGAILARYRIFELGLEPIRVADFERKLVIGVESVPAMLEKLRDMMENRENPEWVEPGIPVICSCPRDLKAHLQDLLDAPELAEKVYARSIAPEPVDIMEMLAQRFGGGGGVGRSRIRIINLGRGSDEIQ